ncbi:MAG: hypothetical protein CL693_08885 [Cellvibrionaceae bacterium]|nr:hypothetical protein [Cellvibrionaceae bacterium]|tara:strand:+ start:12227 stop:13954 length:1728 start_codon:yes stop_codon:yes gene_type:complete
MRFSHYLSVALFALIVLAGAPLQAAPELSVSTVYSTPVGLHFDIYKESQPLSWQDASEIFRRGGFSPSTDTVPNFGLNAGGHWLMARVINNTGEVSLRHLVIDNSWLDKAHLYQLGAELQLLFKAVDGDQYPRVHVRNDDASFVFRLRVPKGESYLLMRVETPDPSPIPVRFYSTAEYETFKDMRMFSYGVFLGFILALMAYNFMLYVGLGERSHLYYSMFLFAFILMAIAYTGYGMHYIYPEATEWAQWSHPIHMMFYGICGLLFASSFLHLSANNKQVYRGVMALIGLTIVAAGVAYAFNSRAAFLGVAFVFAVSYSISMIGLGILAVVSGGKGSRCFLMAVIIGALGAASTTLACMGLIPFNEWTFRGVELGLLTEATLLALALAARFVEVESQHVKMRELAYKDGLTGLSNRRAFMVQSSTLWNSNLRAHRPLCVIMLDIDNFKAFNDSYGHSMGDRALQLMGQLLANQARKGDVAARLGGEEFVVVLPETTIEEATQIADRLRIRVSELILKHDSQSLHLTCSLGVAESCPEDQSIDQVIDRADMALYDSKHLGRDRVSVSGVAVDSEAS